MDLLLALLIGAAGGVWLYKRAKAKAEANFKALIYGSFTGVWAVMPDSPFDETVEERAAEIEAGFIEHGNNLPKYVQRYFFNMLLQGSQGETSTAPLDWANCQVLFAQDYLRRVGEFHAKHAAKDPESATTYFAGQRPSLNTL